jgi:hypothetical protein
MYAQNDSDEPHTYNAMNQTLLLDGKKYSPDILASGDVSTKLAR